MVEYRGVFMKKYTAESALDSGENIKIKIQNANKNLPPHTHEFIEIVYIYSGEGKQTVNGKTYDVKKGDMVFINFGQVHAFPKSDMQYVHILMKPEFMSEKLVNSENIFDVFALPAFVSIPGEWRGLEMASFRGEELVFVTAIIDSMLLEYNEKKSGYRTVLYGYMQVLFTMLIRKLKAKEPPKSSKVIFEISKYIDEHISEKISLNDIALSCFYNPSYFSRKFKECYGKNLKSYILEKRLLKSAKMLSETEKTVADVCLSCGFGDKGQFYKSFKEYFGCTPAQYGKSKKTQPKSK